MVSRALVLPLVFGVALLTGCGSDDEAGLAPEAPAADTTPAVRARGLLLVQTSPGLGRADGDVYLVNVSGGRVRRLTRDADVTEPPQWSPDGRRVLVSIAPHGRRDLWSYPIAGGEPTNVTRTRGWDAHGRWSPDGSRVAFLLQLGDDCCDLYVARAHGGGARLLQRHADAVGWSTDGRSLVFAPGIESRLGFPALWTMPAKGGRPRPLGGGGRGGMVAGISAGPDGRIAYTTSTAFTGSLHLLEQGRDRELPDSSDLQFLRDGSVVYARGQSIVFARPGGRTVTSALPGGAAVPAWSPDGRYLAYVDGESGELYVAHGDGRGPRLVRTGVGPLGYVAWQP